MLPWKVGLMAIMVWGVAHAVPPIAKTQDKLQHLDKKISALKQQLELAQGRQNGIEQLLAVQDKKMSDVVHGLNDSAQAIRDNQLKIDRLSKQALQLSTALQTQQAALSKHLYVRYLMGKTAALKGLLYVKSPTQMNRWVTFFQYLVASRQHVIEQLTRTQQQLNQVQASLKQVQATQVARQTQLTHFQKKLEEEKAAQMVVMNSLTQHITTSQHVLLDYERDKENLARLLQRLMQHPVKRASALLTPSLNASFISPIAGDLVATRPWNQGLLFVTQEGRTVRAVRSGKVVFSDWLRGYGLLIIVDHGHGMMTLYGYNQSLFKHQGEQVVAGQQIATVGHSGGRREDGLYFEVRRFGKVLSANSFL
ncbi:MAG: peptidoglycan DD-metalloendopeptidase family protein [Gammaproteobacteria bacterium]|nr:peptidoglycan DD-metalloendopeptidase family protein [Gammaproteobacteria bacterium]